MRCFEIALRKAGINISDGYIPAPAYIEDIIRICDTLGLEFIGEGQAILGDEPVIVLYRTGKDTGHAEYADSIRNYLIVHDILGIIRLNG